MNRYPQRRSPRLKGYDYSQSGLYFITICTYERQHLFGDILDAEVILSDMGRIAKARWEALPVHHPGISLDAFVVMPNHVHGIICLERAADSACAVPTRTSLSSVIGGYKSSVTKYVRAALPSIETTIWQRRFFDHIIRDERDLNRVREYVVFNPVRWDKDVLMT